MKKVLFTCLFLVAAIISDCQTVSDIVANAIAEDRDFLFSKVVNSEQNVTGVLNIDVVFYAQDNLIINDIDYVNQNLSQSFGIQKTAINNVSLTDGDSIVQSVVLSYDMNQIPFYPISLDIVSSYSTFKEDTSRSSIKIYFTPYNTVEIWDEETFFSLNRQWLTGDQNQERIYISEGEIPVSDLPPQGSYIEDWSDEYNLVYVPGLAYAIPFQRTEPALINEPKSGDCQGNRRNFDYHFKGRIYGVSINNKNMPLNGIKVKVFDNDFLPGVTGLNDDLLWETTTDENGDFEVNIKTCQPYIEGSVLEVYIVFYAYAPDYSIRGKKLYNPLAPATGLYTARHVTEIIELAEKNNHIDLPPLDDIEVEDLHVIGVSNLYNAWKYVENDPELDINLHSGIGLSLVRFPSANTGFFVPNRVAGIIIPTVDGKPTVFMPLNRMKSDAHCYHEFGHFLMWRLQSEFWIEPITGSFSTHPENEETNLRVSFIEGWADAFEGICDLANYHREQHFQLKYELITSKPLVNRGFLNEVFFAGALFDLYDSQSKYIEHNIQPIGIPGTTSQYYDLNQFEDNNELWIGSLEQMELTFKQLCEPFLIHNGPYNLLQNTSEYYYSLQNEVIGDDCDLNRKVKEVFDNNRVRLNANGDTGRGFSSDIIGEDIPIDAGSTSADIFMDKDHLPSSSFSWNLANEPGIFDIGRISDDLLIMSGASLYINRYCTIGKCNGTDTDEPLPNQNATYVANVCSGAIVESLSGGKIEVGQTESSFNNNAVLNVLQNSAIVINSGSGLEINSLSRLIIKEGGTLVIQQGANIDVNGTGAIVIEDGGYICVEEGAVIHLNDGNSSFIMASGAHLGTPYQVFDIENESCISNFEDIEVIGGSICIDCNPDCLYTVIEPGMDYPSNFVVESGCEVSLIGDLAFDEITVREGGKLSVYGNINMTINGSVEVMIGGKLFIDGGRFFCDGGMWNGINASGNEFASQTNSNDQPYIEIINSIIEDARIGANVFRGAILHAENSQFINNINAITFALYNLTNSGLGYNRSYVKKCDFITNIILPASELMQSFIVFANNNKIPIMGCSFENIYSGNTADRGTGIFCANSDFNLVPFCESSSIDGECLTDPIPNRFVGLTQAIYASSSSSMSSLIKIKDAEFINNFQGAKFDNVDNLIVRECEFRQLEIGVGSSEPQLENESYGLYLNGCSGYTITQNKFIKGKAGIIVNASGTSSNEIYDNEFEDINYSLGSTAMLVYGENSNLESGSGFTGLQLRCNQNQGNNHDFALLNANYRINQGDYSNNPEDLAGNTFSYNPYIDQSDYYYGINGDIGDLVPISYAYYYYHNDDLANVEPEDYTSIYYPIAREVEFDRTVACRELEEERNINELIEIIKNIEVTKNLLTDNYNSLVDNGNTEAVLSKIVEINASNKLQTLNELKSIDAMSGKTLKAFLEKDISGQIQRRMDVLINNSPLPEYLLDKLESYNLPKPKIDEIIAIQQGQSQVGAMEKEIIDLNSDLEVLYADLIKEAIRVDTVDVYLDTVINLLNGNDDIEYKLMLAKLYSKIGDYSNARLILSEIESDIQNVKYYNVQDDWEKKLLLEEIAIYLFENGYQDFQPIIDNEQTLRNIASNESTKESVQARVMLEAANLEEFELKYILPETEVIAEDVIEGYLIESDMCGNSPVAGYSIVLVDENLNPISTIDAAVTNSDGSFVFNPVQIGALNESDIVGFKTVSGFEMATTEFKTIGEWKLDANIEFVLSNVNRYWIESYSETDSVYNIGTDIDLSGNIYVAGNVVTINTGYDMIIIKYSPTGERLWVRQYIGSGNDFVSKMIVDDLGNCYVTGTTYNTSNGDSDYITLKFDSDGNEIWRKMFSSPGSMSNDNPYDLAMDENGNICVTGMDREGLSSEIFTVLYDSDGQELWLKNYNNAVYNIAYCTSFDNDGNIIVGGTIGDANNNTDLIILKYSINGDLIHSAIYNSGDKDLLNSMVIDYSNNIIVAGSRIQSGIYDFLTVKFDTDCNVVWLKHKSSTYNDMINDICVDSDGNIYVTGTFNKNYGTVKYSENGDELWYNAYTMHGINASGQALAMDIDVYNNVYITGHTSPTTTKTGNMTTIKYTTHGVEEWVDSYYFIDPTKYNQANDIVVSENNNIYITGYGWNGNNMDMVTVKYSQCFSTANLKNVNLEIDELPIIDKEPSESIAKSKCDIYPNPNDGNMTLDYNFLSEKDGLFIITDTRGIEIERYRLNGKGKKALINNDALTNGTYFYNLYEGETLVEQGKIVVVK